MKQHLSGATLWREAGKLQSVASVVDLRGRNSGGVHSLASSEWSCPSVMDDIPWGWKSSL
jgi:hypothetical protein